MLTEENNILSGYIIPEYEMLHTQSKDYIVDDIIAVIKENSIVLTVLPRRPTDMTANPVLLQKKYARIVERFSERQKLSLNDALDCFYHSVTYRLISERVSNLHCMSDEYLVEELISEYDGKI